MKFSILTGALVLLATLSASAKTFTQDCQTMRDLAVSLSVSLQGTDKDVMSYLGELTKKGTTPDTKSYLENTKGIADTIDHLTYLIDQSCK